MNIKNIRFVLLILLVGLGFWTKPAIASQSIAHSIPSKLIAPTGNCGSSFVLDNDGWFGSGDTTTSPNYVASGGNPDGYLSLADSATGGVWYWEAPYQYLGNISTAYGKTLSFDLKQSSTSNQFDYDDIILNSPNMQLNFDTSYNPNTTWTHYSILLDETAGWQVDGEGRAPTQAEFLAVMVSLIRLRMRGEFRSGADTGGLDNVLLETDNCVGQNNVSCQSAFAHTDEGWRGIGGVTVALPTFHPTGGNPHGYLSLKDTATGGTWYWDAPAPYLGDVSSAYGRTLQFDLTQSSTSSQFDNHDVILNSATMQLNFDTSYNPGTDWTHYRVVLDENAGWSVNGSGVVPTSAEFQAVLADLQQLRIRGEYRSGADTGKLDNVLLETAECALADPTISVAEVVVDEGQPATFAVTLNHASTQTITVDYVSADGSATSGDYTATAGTLTFAPGETTHTISVPTIDDSAIEDNETFEIVLSNLNGAAALDELGEVTATGFLTMSGSMSSLTFGAGGFLAHDLFVTMPGNFNLNDGKIYRVTDNDANGVGEASLLLNGNPDTPLSITVNRNGLAGFGAGLFMLNYPSNTTQRFVHTASNDAALNLAQFSTSSIFNPAMIDFSQDGLLVTAAQTFTQFGGGNDGRIFRVDAAGAVSAWADGNNTLHGLWDNNSTLAMAADGSVVNFNQKVTNQPNELLRFKDLNGDHDANDPGEAFFLAQANLFRGALAYDGDGNLLIARGGYNNTGIYKLIDLNGDEDYWDATSGDFDAGELTVLIEGLTGYLEDIEVADDGTLYVIAYQLFSGRSVIYHITSTVNTTRASATIRDNDTPSTAVSADISSDTVWDIAGSPYYVQSPQALHIQNGATLTITADVEVLVDGSQIVVDAGGSLVVEGVVFTSHLPQSTWAGIVVASGGSAEFRYCTIERVDDGNIGTLSA
ncbi:MAG TPA: hypothetical protein ENJ56_00900, partial [Anaerolineae bacterium]|nr:hypothetical protein [Anaerolineae bacterium]